MGENSRASYYTIKQYLIIQILIVANVNLGLCYVYIYQECTSVVNKAEFM